MQIKLLEQFPHKQEPTSSYLVSQGLSVTILERFWSKVQKTDACWIWIAHRTKKGYGRLGKGVGRGAKSIGAHRVSWLIHYGPIPNGLCVLHHCDVSACVRPDHLWLGTKTDNNLDQSEKGRRAKYRRLTSEQVAQMKAMYSTGNYSQKELGVLFGIHQTGVGKICRGETWKDPDNPGFRLDLMPHSSQFIPLRKATPESIRQMKEAYATGQYTYDTLGKRFGVSIGYAYHIVNYIAKTHP